MAEIGTGKSRAKGMLLVFLAGLIWSFSGVLSKFIAWNAFSVIGFRSLIAALILGGYRKSFRIVNKKVIWIGTLGTLGTAVLYMIANKITSAANAIVLQYAMPLVVIGYRALVKHDRIRGGEYIAAGVVLLGVVLCFAQGFSSGGMPGNILALITAGTWAAVFLAAKEPGGDSMVFTYQSSMIAVLFLIAMPFDPGVAQGGVNWLMGIALGVSLGIGYLLFSLGMREEISPVDAAIIANVEPVMNPTWCFLFLGENPGPLSIIGAVLVLVAVTVYSVIGSRKQA